MAKSRKYAKVDVSRCVACGACTRACPRGAISVVAGSYAFADPELCVGCGLCGKSCPVGCIKPVEREQETVVVTATATAPATAACTGEGASASVSPAASASKPAAASGKAALAAAKKRKPWYQYLWIWSIVYFSLGFFNILFAWLGMIDFILPLLFAVIGGNKFFCNNFCGRGQLFTLLGAKLKLSRNKTTPRMLSSRGFRYGFLVFFLTMFGNMVFQTWLVARGAQELRQVVKLFWTFRLPWKWAYQPGLLPEAFTWLAQFSYGFYSLMLTSTLIGLIVMLLYKPRSWCTFCPMGTMTQGICRLKYSERSAQSAGKSRVSGQF